ncbi:MAG: alpha-2-macroglobulin family protein [Nannocystales bacterium]
MARVSTLLHTPARALLVLALACTSSSNTSEQDSSSPVDVDTSKIPSDGPALLFPPPLTRRDRRLLPPDLAGVDDDPTEPLTVEWPELDDKGRWETSGQTITLRLNNRAKRKGKTPPPLTITPAVKGRAQWNSDWSVSFHADAPFDPETDYTLALGPVEDESGASMEWKGVFRADPRIWIGGKMVTYIPEPGKPRVVTFYPHSGTKQGPRPEMTVLFDQPVTAEQVKELITLTNAKGKALEFSLKHPKKGLFDGAKADKRNMLVVRPKRRMWPGGKGAFTVRDHGAAEETADRIAFDIARRPKFTKVDCRYDSERCKMKGDTLHIGGREVALHFNNIIEGGKSLEAAVSVDPPIRNLSVWSQRWSSDGQVTVSGAFEPSRDYTLTLASAKDTYGQSLAAPVVVKLRTAPRPTSVSMPEGLQFLDTTLSKSFKVTTRNVDGFELRAWEVGDSDSAWQDANGRVSRREAPTGKPTLTIPFSPTAKQDKSVTSKVNLLEHLGSGKAYVVELKRTSTAFDAPEPTHPSWSRASKPPLALVLVNDDTAMVVHARGSGDKTFVHVAEMTSGAPVSGATLFVDGTEATGIRTDKDGLAVLDLAMDKSRNTLLRVESGTARTILPMGHRVQTNRHLVPELSGGMPLSANPNRGLVMSDRGVYRPGATVHVKGMMRRPDGADLLPVAKSEARIRIVDPRGKTAFTQDLTTDDMGSVSASWTTEEGSPIGRYQVELQAMPGEETLGRTQVQVAEFEPPRFKVDVEAKTTGSDKKRKVEGNVVAKYLFGAAMDGAEATWVVRRASAPMPKGALTARGLSFTAGYVESGWSRSGYGTLDAKGALQASPVVEVDQDGGPQTFTFEAEVTDSSHRAIAGRDSVVVHPAPYYAGVRIKDRWPDVGTPLDLELGVIDQAGTSVVGKSVTAELVRMEWKRTRKPGPGGSTRLQWHRVEIPSGRCTAKSALAVVSCELTPKVSGSYEVRTKIDGRSGGRAYVWAWGADWSGSEPEPGHRMELVADAKTFAPGQTAKIVAQNPFEKATAIFTVEQGTVLKHEAREVDAGPVTFEVPIEAKHAPHVFASVTFLPRDARGEQLAQWKFGALKLPVSLDDATLEVSVSADAKAYEPREHAEIEVSVVRGGTPVAGAEVVLAVVDEGVLRLTNYKAPDPVKALRPGAAFNFSIADTRTELADMLQRSHTAGDGGGASGNASLVSTRKNFVRTALWRPHLRTGEDGTVKVGLDLPDNLTEFRMMAVVLDNKGRGGRGKGAFNVRKPLMIQPAVPRFALEGDSFEAAVMVHNGLDEAVEATVTLDDKTQSVSLAAMARKRVAFTATFEEPGEKKLVFEVKDDAGTVRDRVESIVPVQAAGIDERPRLAGAFNGAQEVLLEVPAGITTDLSRDAVLRITMGHHAWPELGSRLEYLIDYPHGCVEQTTSSTLPLLAARDVLPRLGLFRFSEEEIDAMALAGLKRLATMKTSSGGLAYWPGGTEPNLYGTAYAARAIALAKKQGIEVPGLLDEVTEYLAGRLDDTSSTARRDVEQRASIALALAEAGALPESAADMLVDTLPNQGPFGSATVALALSSLEGHEDQVNQALDAVEAAFEADGSPKKKDEDSDFYYYGSTTRTQAQAALALVRLRATSTLIPTLVDALVRKTGSYTTQATAFGLLALREKVVSDEGEDARVVARLDGVPLTSTMEGSSSMGSGAGAFTIPFADVAGRHAVLRLETTGETPVSFQVGAAWRRPFTAGDTQVETSAVKGPEVYRLYTTAKGEPVDMSGVAPGTVVRVALLARMPSELEHDRRGYLAMTDRLPAGFEPIQPDLWTVSRPAELTDAHPMYNLLQWGSADASYVEMRDDRVHLYFDRFWGEYVAGTYTMRATTPGQYTVPPAMAELMYEPDSTGYSKDATVVVTP